MNLGNMFKPVKNRGKNQEEPRVTPEPVELAQIPVPQVKSSAPAVNPAELKVEAAADLLKPVVKEIPVTVEIENIKLTDEPVKEMKQEPGQKSPAAAAPSAAEMAASVTAKDEKAANKIDLMSSLFEGTEEEKVSPLKVLIDGLPDIPVEELISDITRVKAVIAELPVRNSRNRRGQLKKIRIESTVK